MADMSHPDDWFEVERLHRAARDGDVKEMERLVAAHYDVNLFDDLSRAPLHYAVEGEHYKAAEWLLNHGACVNRYEDEKIGETALCFAVQQDYPEMVELLMKHGADPDIPGWMGQTARYRAYKRKDEDGKKICSILERYACPNK
jgi:ankyrin repeat protein